jgi:hypothetical protein
MNSEDYSITIEDRCEGICYREGENEYHFGVLLGREPHEIDAYEYWDGCMRSSPRSLSEEEKARIIPRLVDYLKRDEPNVEVCVNWERAKDHRKIKTSWELFLERRKARGIEE